MLFVFAFFVVIFIPSLIRKLCSAFAKGVMQVHSILLKCLFC